MSEQNRYQIERNIKTATGNWVGWLGDVLGETADTWQDAIHKWLDRDVWTVGEYTVISETPSEDGKSGIIEIQFVDPPTSFWEGAKIKATLI